MTQMIDQLLQNLSALYGETVTRQQLIEYAANSNTSLATICKTLEPNKTGRGVWNLTVAEKLEQNFNTMTATPATPAISFIPQKDKNYVSFGNFTDVKRII